MIIFYYFLKIILILDYFFYITNDDAYFRSFYCSNMVFRTIVTACH